jgi:hypothetical protein
MVRDPLNEEASDQRPLVERRLGRRDQAYADIIDERVVSAKRRASGEALRDLRIPTHFLAKRQRAELVAWLVSWCDAHVLLAQHHRRRFPASGELREVSGEFFPMSVKMAERYFWRDPSHCKLRPVFADVNKPFGLLAELFCRERESSLRRDTQSIEHNQQS